MLQWQGFNQLDLKINEGTRYKLQKNKKSNSQQKTKLLMVHNAFENDHYFLNKHKIDET